MVLTDKQTADVRQVILLADSLLKSYENNSLSDQWFTPLSQTLEQYEDNRVFQTLILFMVWFHVSQHKVLFALMDTIRPYFRKAIFGTEAADKRIGVDVFAYRSIYDSQKAVALQKTL
jgi:hypothetical protein